MAANALRLRAGDVESVAGMGSYADKLRKVAHELEAPLGCGACGHPEHQAGGCTAQVPQAVYINGSFAYDGERACACDVGAEAVA